MGVDGKMHYAYVHSTPLWTLLDIHPKRGKEAFDELGVLTDFRGTVVHDCFVAYFKPEYRFQHALCNAHILRELQGIVENDHHQWASDMKVFLQDAWTFTKKARENGNFISTEELESLSENYDHILEDGEKEWRKDAVPAKTGPRGRKCKSIAHNLGARMKLHKRAILRFLWDAYVPFDNNQAERDLRMLKVKQKISGTYRTAIGAMRFIRIRSFISTLIKQQLPVLSSIRDALNGEFSFMPT